MQLKLNVIILCLFVGFLFVLCCCFCFLFLMVQNPYQNTVVIDPNGRRDSQRRVGKGRCLSCLSRGDVWILMDWTVRKRRLLIKKRDKGVLVVRCGYLRQQILKEEWDWGRMGVEWCSSEPRRKEATKS